jgi:regulator of sigma E protease
MEFLLLANFGEIVSYIGYVLLAVLVLLAMITVHEFGHYITGKIFGFGIEEFSIGFGPKLFQKEKKNGELFSVRLLPLGGFCSFKGEDADDPDPTAFNNKKPWQRLIVLISGAFMNYLFALLIIVITFFSYGQTALVTYKMSENPAYSSYSFAEKDVILKANGKNVYMVPDLMSAIEDKEQGDLVKFTVRRAGEIKDIEVMLRCDTDFSSVEDAPTLYDALGIYYQTNSETGEMTDVGLYQTGIKFGFFRTIGRSVDYSFRLAASIFTVLKQLITGALGIGAIGGTVTTITVTADAIKVGGLRYLLNMASLIGVNLAVFNLLPIPALDGSRAVFTLIEWIRRKPISRRVEGVIHGIGLVVLLCFALLVDLQQCF